MSTNKRIDENLILGPGTRGNSLDAKLLVDFDPGNSEGVALDVAPSAAGGNERAGIKLGNFFLGQDPAKTGSTNFGVADASGTLIHEFVDVAGARPVRGPESLYQIYVPLVVTPTGSMGDNGALTSGTACSLAYNQSYCWFPEGAINAADVGPPVIDVSPAGWYYTEWSSVTEAIVYNNVWDGVSVPTIPATPTAFVTTGPGAFTGPTTAAIYISLPITLAQSPVGTTFRVKLHCAATNNANAKTIKLWQNDDNGEDFHTVTLTSLAAVDADLTLTVITDTAQLSDGMVFGATAIARLASAKEQADLSVDWVLAFAVAKATATDFLAIERIQILREE